MCDTWPHPVTRDGHGRGTPGLALVCSMDRTPAGGGRAQGAAALAAAPPPGQQGHRARPPSLPLATSQVLKLEFQSTHTVTHHRGTRTAISQHL